MSKNQSDKWLTKYPGASQKTRKEKRAIANKLNSERLERNGGLDAIELCYERYGKTFFIKHDGVYEDYPESKIKLILQQHGISEHETHPSGVKMIDFPFLDAMNNRKFDYAGSLPGYRRGPNVDASGRRLLITEEAHGVFDDLGKVKGQPEFFCDFVWELLGEEQAEHYCYYLAYSLLSLRRHDWRTAPFVWFVGVKNCGKSLLQYFTKHIFGGRSQNPAPFLLKKTNFNGELMEGEYWFFGDPDTTTDMRTRTSLGEMLKMVFHEEEFTFAPKHKKQFTVPCFRRGSGSINDQREQYQIIPPMIDGVVDKNSLYRCKTADRALARFVVDGQPALKGFDPVGGADKIAIKATVQKELPLIRAWLLQNFIEVPEKWRDSRYGVAAYHNKGLLSDLAQLSPEARFLEYMDEVLFEELIEGAVPASRKMRAMAIQNEMRDSKFGAQLRESLHKTGTYLGRLAKSHPDRVAKAEFDSGGNQLWVITNPYEKEQNNGEK